MHKLMMRVYFNTSKNGTSFIDQELITSRFYFLCWIVGKILIKCMHLHKCENEEYAKYADKDYNITLSYW